MYLRNKQEEILRLLEACDALAGCRVTAAYPYTKKPTLLQKPTVTVSSAAVKGEACSLGESRQLLRYEITVGVFVPHRDGTAAVCRLVQEVTDALLVTAPAEVSVAGTEVRDELGCYAVMCRFVYSDGTGGTDGD